MSPPERSLIDIGGGASTLVDNLLALGHLDLAVLDVSEVALDAARTRLDDPSAVTWIGHDLLTWHPARRWDVWHDRAVLHFLVDDEERSTYRGCFGEPSFPAARSWWAPSPRTAPPTARRCRSVDTAPPTSPRPSVTSTSSSTAGRSTAPRAGSSSRSTGSPDACGTPTWATVLPTYPSPPDQRSHRRRGAHRPPPEVGSGVGGRAAGVGGGDGLRPGRTAGRRVGAGGDRRTLRLPRFGPGGELGGAYAGFAERRFGWPVDPDHVLPVVDVTAALRLALDVLSEPGPVVLPVPAYSPHHAIGELTGRERVDLVLGPGARAEIDLDRLDRLFRDGAGTLLLTQPHNPWGRVFTRAELEGIRDVVLRHGGRVVSDEVHGPLVLPGAEHVSYLQIEGTHEHAVALVSASKAFNIAGLRCAQIIAPDRAAMERLFLAPPAQRLVVVARRRRRRRLLPLVRRLAGGAGGPPRRAAHPARRAARGAPSRARMRPLEATYLAWIDLRAYGHPDPARVARKHGRVLVSAGQEFQPDLTGHIRLNVATSAERLTEIVRRLASRWPATRRSRDDPALPSSRSPSPQAGGGPAVDRDDGAGDEAGPVRGEEHASSATSSGWPARFNAEASIIWGTAPAPGPPDISVSMNPGQMALARMPFGPYSMAGRLGEGDDARLGGAVDARADRGVHAADRRPVQDGAAAGRDHGPDAVLGPEHDALEVDAHDPVVLLEGEVGQHPARSQAGDVEHDVDAAERLEGGREHRLDARLVGHVALEGHDGPPSSAAVSSCRPLMSAASTLAPSRTNTPTLGPSPNPHR